MTLDVRKMPIADEAAIAAIKKAVGIEPGMTKGPLAPAPAAAKAVKPGKERWPVKTGTDDDIAKVKPVIVPATLEELIRAVRPPKLKDPAKLNPEFQSKRATPVETTIWQIDASIVGIKFEDDGDYHVVLQGASGEFMVGEVPAPDPPFVNASSPFVENIRQVRKALDKKFFNKMRALQFLPMGKNMVPVEAFSSIPRGTTPRDFTAAAAAAPMKAQVKPTKVRLTGVGFFDRTHGQTGGAPNGIELHPMLSVKFL